MADTTSKVRKGGLVDKRMQAMESSAGAAAPASGSVEVAEPAPAPEPMGDEEKALRRKYGMAVPGEEKPSALSKIKKALGFASKP